MHVCVILFLLFSSFQLNLDIIALSVVRGVASSETQGQIVGSGSQRDESGVNKSLQEQRGELLGCYY